MAVMERLQTSALIMNPMDRFGLLSLVVIACLIIATRFWRIFLRFLDRHQ
jgi:hypothetical protein